MIGRKIGRKGDKDITVDADRTLVYSFFSSGRVDESSAIIHRAPPARQQQKVGWCCNLHLPRWRASNEGGGGQSKAREHVTADQVMPAL